MKKSIQFIQCLTIINGNVEARRSLRAFRLKLGLVNKQGSFLRPLKTKLPMQKRHSLYIIHTSRLRSICFSFETFTTLISQLNFCFSLFFFQASIHFHFLYFFFSFTSYLQNRCFFFLIFFNACSVIQELWHLTILIFVLPNLSFTHPK